MCAGKHTFFALLLHTHGRCVVVRDGELQSYEAQIPPLPRTICVTLSLLLNLCKLQFSPWIIRGIQNKKALEIPLLLKRPHVEKDWDKDNSGQFKKVCATLVTKIASYLLLLLPLVNYKPH
jgi:hypothetical protein